MTIPQAKSHTAGDVNVRFTPLYQGGIQVRATRNGEVFHAQVHTHSTPAEHDYQRLTALHPIAVEGDGITCQAGTHTVSLTIAREGARVETVNAGGLVEGWSRTFATEDEARSNARRAVLAFRTHGTEQGIAQAYTALTFRMRDLLNGRRTTRTQLAALEAELDALADFDSTIAALDALAA